MLKTNHCKRHNWSVWQFEFLGDIEQKSTLANLSVKTMYWKDNEWSIELMEILGNKAWEMGWNKRSAQQLAHCQKLLRGTVCLGRCLVGPRSLDTPQRLPGSSCLSQWSSCPISLLHSSSLLENQRLSSQNTVGQVHAGAPVTGSNESDCLSFSASHNGEQDLLRSQCNITANQERCSDAT